jgi:hypothetical protein
MDFSRPQPGCHLPNSPWPGIIGEGKIANLFYSASSKDLFPVIALNYNIIFLNHLFNIGFGVADSPGCFNVILVEIRFLRVTLLLCDVQYV